MSTENVWTTSKPTVTVVVPTYNSGSHIRECLRSLLDQDYEFWEAIIVDNYSNDDTLYVASSFRDARIRIIRENNQGCVAHSRNLAVRMSSCEWIAFLDSDDTWSKDKLRLCSRYFNAYDLIYHPLDLRPRSKMRVTTRTKDIQEDSFRSLVLDGNVIPTSSVIVRKSILESVGLFEEDNRLSPIEDYHCWLKVALAQGRFKYVNKALGSYCYRSDSTSRIDVSLKLAQLYRMTRPSMTTAIWAKAIISVFYNKLCYDWKRRSFPILKEYILMLSVLAGQERRGHSERCTQGCMHEY